MIYKINKMWRREMYGGEKMKKESYTRRYGRSTVKIE
jgi:hypothetical protein